MTTLKGAGQRDTMLGDIPQVKEERSMNCNVGGIDRAIRILAGSIIGVYAIWWGPATGGWHIVLYTVAAIALTTGLLKFCPVSALLGINTRRLNE